VQTDSFQVRSGVSYFAHVNAIAGGPLDLGLYSISLTFAPATSPVPLPPSGWLFLAAIALALGVLYRGDGEPGAAAAHSTSARA